jgi:signal transduction histidine kinase
MAHVLTRRVVRFLLWLLVVVFVVGVAFGAMILVFGRVPDRAERGLAGPALLAIAIAVVLIVVLHDRLRDGIDRISGRDTGAPADLARSLSSRMSRSVPLDELVLQAAEGLRSSLRLSAAETWLLADGSLRPWIGDPQIHRPPMPLGEVEPGAVVQAGLSAHGWLQVWMPQMLEGRERSYVRLAPMANAGELQGVVVAERPVDDRLFTQEEERAIVEVARQLGAMLHNAKLDSALQASLDEVRRQADEIQASRGRIVAAADQARRKIERDLHDGAQQHLVALAVRVKLVEQLLERDPEKARAALDDLESGLEDALQELRDLAHGIYPPLLADKGISAALTRAARRAAQVVTVDADGLGRFAPEAEATVYFCVLEAIQNAGKYAGDGATVTIRVREEDHTLTFVVSDDGVGFDVRGAGMGAGFTNMLDRLGALGGTLRVDSAPGQGTRVTGTVPVQPG